ncbi:hypothetical protein AG1IA_05743 [Rhizoctonia solani AG-1 IA]|uniref:Uncharacterized protein n=1 Tax=Thanatephorus cucumeris (strain AG1-IA) TaxID=983506 RepID=L8WV60_THACA|nr:hypothetical protein AG1IA_05743 [Rhizoctonia solani AG-1 IA]
MSRKINRVQKARRRLWSKIDGSARGQVEPSGKVVLHVLRSRLTNTCSLIGSLSRLLIIGLMDEAWASEFDFIKLPVDQSRCCYFSFRRPSRPQHCGAVTLLRGVPRIGIHSPHSSNYSTSIMSSKPTSVECQGVKTTAGTCSYPACDCEKK